MHGNGFLEKVFTFVVISSNSIYDFKTIDDKAHQAPIPIVQEQGFKVVKFFKNMRNGSHIVEDSYKLHDGIIEKGTTGGCRENIQDQS